VKPLQKLLESDKPYAGGLIPQANSAMAELQRQLGERLGTAKAKALEEISEQEARLKATADFQKLDTSQQEQVLAATATAKADVEGASQPGRVSLRVNRYRAEEVPKQLQRMAALAAPDDTDVVAPITVVAASALKVNCPLSQITSSQELEQWLEALREAAQAELDQGHRISL
jgi:hypothetical protein